MSEYAKDSDNRLAAARKTTPPETEVPELESEVRLRTHPGIGAPNEAWAATMAGSPIVCLDPTALKRLPLDHRTGYLLSLMDGMCDLETIIAIASMPRAEVLRIVRDLEESGVIQFED